MPQDGLRSAVYRSFVTCDDPKGVVECKTIRKSKNKNHSTQQNSSLSEENKDKKFLKGSKEQIMEVSKGAQKLNQVISSFSNRPSFDHKLIAQDLLKGAIDLQESLEMLGKLQEASKFITKRNNNKEKPEIMGFEKPRNSCCSSSRDCFDELRDAITESFARQNLLPRACSKREEDFLDVKNLDFCTDFASTSSSSCSSSKAHHEKSKRPNLIAKLMGLEEVPSKAMIYKGVDHKEEISNGRFNLLDNDLPRPRKPQFVVQKVARERRTLEEMMETMQFKGLLERKFDNGEHCSCHGSFVRNNLVVEGPPIVIMRPRHVGNYGIYEERNVKSRQKPIKRSEEFPRGEMKFKETNEKLRVERVSKKKLNKDKEVIKCSGEEKRKMNNCKPVVPRVQKKEVVVKKIDNMAKTASDTRKQAEIKDVKFPDVGKITTLKLKKSGRGSNAPKKTLKSNIPKKNLKKGKHESKLSEALVESLESDCRLPNNDENDVEGSLIKSTTSEKITEEVMDTSYIFISDNSGNEESYPCESSIKDDIKDIEEDICISHHSTDTKEACKCLTDTKNLLLSNISFLSRADELFDTGKLCDPTIPQTCSLPDIDQILDASLSLECAKEILEHKGMRSSRMKSPLSQNYLFIEPKCNVSLEKLVMEICDEIEHLRNYYSKSCGDTVLGDSIHPMLERDLCSNGEVKSSWDLGWRENGYTMEEVDELVHDVEKMVWTEIVDDVVMEFML